MKGFRFCRPQSNRLKRFTISPEALVTFLFTLGERMPTVLTVPSFANVPSGVRVVGVDWDFDRQRFSFALEHESFEEVPDGMCLPSVEIVVSEALMTEYVKQTGNDVQPDCTVG